jgi:glycosyltransferase involved in cell wall biosynthesis
MRILVLNYEFPPIGGGAAPVSYELSKKYIEQGHVVDIVTMHYKGLKFFEKINELSVYRINCLRQKKETCEAYEMLSFIINAKKFLKKRLKKIKYDVCHTHFIIPTGIIALWLKRKYNLNYIITAHGTDVPGYNPDRFRFLHNFTKPLLKSICKNAKLIITPSNYLKNLITKNIGKYLVTRQNNMTTLQNSKFLHRRQNISNDNSCNLKVKEIYYNIKTIPNGIDQDNYTKQKKENIIVSSGRLLPRKGFQYLINAIKDEKLNYELHILGDGPFRNELQKLSKNSKTKIVFHGWISNKSDEYKKILGKAKIYVLASLKENASIALLEAMSASCAIITTNISGCPETVGKSGILVDPKNTNQIKENILNLIKDEKLMKSYQNKSRRRLLDKFTWDKISKEYENELI